MPDKSITQLRETQVWLKIVKQKHLITPDQIVADTLGECDELIAIFVSSVATAKRNMQHGSR